MTTRIDADHRSVKRLGRWTDDRAFQVRNRHGSAVIDLRSPLIPDGDIELDLDVHRGTVKLLVAEDAVVDHWDLAWTGRGRVKATYHHNPHGGGRRIHLSGRVHSGEIRVCSGGIAQLTAMCSRDFFADARRAHREGGVPTVDDPTRVA